MKKKIIFSMSCIALLSILLSMVLSGVVSYYDSLEIVKKATIAESRYIQNGIALGGDDYLSDIRSAGYDTAAAQSVRVTVIDTDGTVRFDSVADAANMENHNNRPEVIAARENGAGESVRESDTLNVQSYNYAVMLSDGRVLRLSVGMKTVFGSIERFIGIITEHFAGAFPLWLAPVQVKVMPITDRTNNYAKHVADRLEKAGLRVETDLRNEKIGYKIREAQSQKIPYMLVLGDKEAENDTISVRTLSGEQSVEGLPDFIARLQADVKSRKS